MTLPRLAALTKRWKDVPPADIQLARIAAFLGIKPVAAIGGDPRIEARKAGIPLMMGRLPDDPDIGFLDDNIGLGMKLH